MSDPALIDRIMQTCSFRFRNVVCPNKDKLAKITAAGFHLDDSEWSVVECSLLPNGYINCAMNCLLRELDPRN